MIRLRALKPSDLTYFQTWWRDKELIALTSGDFSKLSDRQVQAYFNEEIDSKTVIGHASLSQREDRWYETQIVLGDKSARGKGYGPVALQ